MSTCIEFCYSPNHYVFMYVAQTNKDHLIQSKFPVSQAEFLTLYFRDLLINSHHAYYAYLWFAMYHKAK